MWVKESFYSPYQLVQGTRKIPRCTRNDKVRRFCKAQQLDFEPCRIILFYPNHMRGLTMDGLVALRGQFGRGH